VPTEEEFMRAKDAVGLNVGLEEVYTNQQEQRHDEGLALKRKREHNADKAVILERRLKQAKKAEVVKEFTERGLVNNNMTKDDLIAAILAHAEANRELQSATVDVPWVITSKPINSSMSKEELRAECAKKEFPQTGNKKELLARLGVSG
jgi:hypothetical protein